MGLEEVKQEILSGAEQEAKRIIGEGSAEAARIMKDAEKDVEAYRISRAEDVQRIAQQLERREMAQAEFDAKKRALDKKKEMIERAFAMARDALACQPEAVRKSILQKLFARARRDITIGCIYISSRDRKLLKLEQGSGKQAAGTGISIKEKQMLGGLIAETPDGTISVDYSYERFLNKVQEADIRELSSILFG